MNIKGIPVALPRHVDHYVNMPRSELSLMTADQLFEIAYELYSFAYHLQTVNNQQVAKAEKCRADIDKIIGPCMDNYRHIYGKDEKRLAAISENESAMELQGYETMARAAATRTSYLTQRIDNMARCLLELAKSREGDYASKK